MPQADDVEIAVLTPRTLLKPCRVPISSPVVTRRKRILSWSLAALLLAATTTWAVAAIRHHVVYGTVAGEDHRTLTVDRGDRFSIAIRDLGRSVGDHWTAEATPAAAVRTLSERKVAGNLLERVGIHIETMGGGQGTRYFRYDAIRTGTVTVTLSNCFQGCHEPSPYSRSVSWTITVR